MITSDQIRAARALLRWSADDLARHANIGVATIRRFELQEGVPSGQIRILEALKSALETAGVEFTGSQTEGVGVKLVRSHST
ncbi:MAG TPA: helix-turn-helix transcriptional regulator [Methylotenera sp.]